MSWVVSLTFENSDDAQCMFRMLTDAKHGNGLVFTQWPGSRLTYSDIRSMTSVKWSEETGDEK
jgi:hypothetical protein